MQGLHWARTAPAYIVPHPTNYPTATFQLSNSESNESNQSLLSGPPLIVRLYCRLKTADCSLRTHFFLKFQMKMPPPSNEKRAESVSQSC